MEPRTAELLTRRQVLAGAAAAALTACAGPERRAQPSSIPLVYDAQGSLFVLARIQGRDPVRLILDTGAERSTLSTAYATRLGLTLRDGNEIEGTAGVVRSQSAEASLEIPGLGSTLVDFAVYGFSSYDPECVGILGQEWLRRAPFQLRYREPEPALIWNAPSPGPGIAMTLDHGIPRVAARVQQVDLDLRIDTGAALAPGREFYVNLTGAQARACGLTGRPAAVWKASGTGGATLDLPVHRLDSFQLAGRSLAPVLAILQPPVGYFARADAVGFLGNAVLDKLDPFFDYAGSVFALGG